MIQDVFKLSKKQLTFIRFTEMPYDLEDQEGGYVLYHPSLNGLEGEEFELYCRVLLDVGFKLPSRELPDFVDQQIELLVEPCIWLEQFVQLLVANQSLLAEKVNTKIRFYELRLLLAEALQEWSPHIVRFSDAPRERVFMKIKQEAGNYENTFDALDYLAEVKIRVHAFVKDASERAEMDRKILALMDHLRIEEQLKKERMAQEGIPTHLPKLVWTGEIRDLVTVFYAIMIKENKQGERELKNKLGDLIEFIHHSFLRPGKKRIAKSTIKTILTPSRSDKRGHGIPLPELFEFKEKED